MSDQPDLSLPSKAPSMVRYHDQAETLYPAALYSLVDLTDSELQNLQRDCEAGCIDTGASPDQSVRPAPQWRFAGQPLRAIMDYHLELGTQNEYDARWFIAATAKDWKTKGVVLVTLDDDDLECNVDQFRIAAKESGLSVANLQIGNSSWAEEKQNCGLDPHEQGPAAADSGGGGGGGDDDDDDDDNDDGPPAPSKNIPLGYYVPIYVHSSVSDDDVVATLEPSFKIKSPEDRACRVQAKLEPGPSATLVARAAALHPLRCRKNRWLHKTYLLVVDTADPAENGMLMIHLSSWDGDTTASKASLGRAGARLAASDLPHIRVPFSCYDGLQRRYMALASGDATWPPDSVRAGPVFAVFQYDTHGKDLGFASSRLDPAAPNRQPGEERLVHASAYLVPQSGPSSTRWAWSFDEAVRCFPWLCRQKRFVEGLDKTFFLCVDGNDVPERGVLLGRRDWDGGVWGRTDEELLALPVENVRRLRVPVGEALGLLEKGGRGETDGMSDEFKVFFQQ